MTSWIGARALAAVAVLSLAGHAHAQQAAGNVPKQVHLVLDGNRVVASNVRLNRFDELKLAAQERIRDQQVGEAVAIVITNQRFVAYGVLSGWRSMDRAPNEAIQSVSAQDFAGLIVTDQRMLNFNGETGVWAEQRRNVRR